MDAEIGYDANERTITTPSRKRRDRKLREHDGTVDWRPRQKNNRDDRRQRERETESGGFGRPCGLQRYRLINATTGHVRCTAVDRLLDKCS